MTGRASLNFDFFQMRSRVPAWGFPLLIVTIVAGCDNVIWGGADVQIVPPPPPIVAADLEGDSTAVAEPGLPTGPLIFHLVDTEGGGSQLIPIAEIASDGLRPVLPPGSVDQATYEARFRETVIPIGSQFDVFRRGVRVGTFVAQANGPLTQCGVPTVVGNNTVVAAAVDASEYLAFRQGLAPESRGDFAALQVTGPIRTYSAIVAERLILQAGLPRPRSWTGAERNLQPIDPISGGHPEMAATYLVGDNLGIGAPEPAGYSVFYIADYETQRGYMPVYSEVRDYRSTGKAAPRLIDYANWDGAEGMELMIQVFGRTQSWYEVVGLRNGEWQKVWEGEPCT